MDLGTEIDVVARANAFSGVVRVDGGDATPFQRAYGFADRGHRVANTVDTRFGIASGTKGLTALTVMALVEQGTLALGTTARSLLGDDLPLIADDVTVEHLLGHRSGIGDYLDESTLTDITDYLMSVPVHLLGTTEGYLPMLAGHPAKFAAGTSFAYCNGGYVLLALLAERATGRGFHDLVATLVCAPAGMGATGFPRADEPDATMATGYLHADGQRTNVFHLPVRGSGDGGAFSTAADIRSLWASLFAGRIVRPDTVAAMVTPRSTRASNGDRYGLGFWLPSSGNTVALEGYDAGVSFRSVHDSHRDLTCTVMANTTEGAWPVARRLVELFGL